MRHLPYPARAARLFRRNLLPALLCGFSLAASAEVPRSFGSVAGKIDRVVVAMVRDPAKDLIYATTTANTVVAINTETLAIDTEIAVGSNPSGLDISPDGSTVYVANSGSSTEGITVIDLKALKAERNLGTTRPPRDIAAGLDGKLFVLTDNSLQQIDQETGAVQADSQIRGTPAPRRFPPFMRPPATPKPQPVTRNESRRTFLLAYSAGENPLARPVALVAGDKDKTVAPINVRIYLGMLRISPDHKTLYYANSGLSPNTLYRLDVSDHKPAVVQEAMRGSNGLDLVVNPAGGSLCYPSGSGNGGGYDVALIPANDVRGQIASFPVGAYPCNGAFSADGALFYTAPMHQETVKIYDVKRALEVATFKIPSQRVGRLMCDRKGVYLFATGQSDTGESKPLLVFSIQRKGEALAH